MTTLDCEMSAQARCANCSGIALSRELWKDQRRNLELRQHRGHRRQDLGGIAPSQYGHQAPRAEPKGWRRGLNSGAASRLVHV